MSEKGEELLNSEAGGKNVVESSGKASEEVKQPEFMPTLVSEHEIDSARARQEEEWRSDLFRLENEMSTLKSVLSSKIREAEEIKKKLGITTLGEFKEDIKLGFQNFKESEPVQKTSAAFKDFGEFASKKLENIRNSNAFKSVEEKVGGAYSSVKKRISSNKSDDHDSEEIETGQIADASVTSPAGGLQNEYTPLKP